MTRPILRLPLDAAADALIADGSLTLDEAPYASAPGLGDPYPQSLRIRFSLTDPASDTPELRPLFPGNVRFIADSSAPGGLPDPSEVMPANYANWKVRGTLRVDMAGGPTTLRDLLKPSGVDVTTAWYGPVELTPDFLFTTVARSERTLIQGAGQPDLTPKDAAFGAHAVSRFLRGEYQLLLKVGADAAGDDVQAKPMPRLCRTANGAATVQLRVTFAQGCSPRSISPKEQSDDPAHPMFGAVPARLVYQLASAAGKLVDTPVAGADVAALTAAWPVAPRFFAIRFTRGWLPAAAISPLFPDHTVRVTSTAGAILAEQRAPRHGVFFLQQSAAPIVPVAPAVSVDLDATSATRMLLVDGSVPDVWKQPASYGPIRINFATTPHAHIQVRRPMPEAMLKEPIGSTPRANACVFFSMRRAVRAFIDTRITGGLLNETPNLGPSGAAERLMTAAWRESPRGASPAAIVRGEPAWSVDPDTGSSVLLGIMRALFPTMPALASGKRTYAGEAAYWLWISAPDVMAKDSQVYGDDYVGRGAAGALAYLDLGQYAAPPDATAIEDDEQYASRNVNGIFEAQLKPGALIQFWGSIDGFEALQNRRIPTGLLGHSMVFVRYVSDSEFIVIDQQGYSACRLQTLDNYRQRIMVTWLNPQIEPIVWIAANWTD